MIGIQRISPEMALVFKEVRLRALKESPLAFGSTYAKERLLTEGEWHLRAARWSVAENDAILLAFDGESACGIVGSYREPERWERAQVISMWVDPEYRRAGLGKALIDAVVEWNRERGVSELVLMVTSVNATAMAFYERLGFSKTGVTGEYPNDAAIIEYEMMLTIDQDR